MATMAQLAMQLARLQNARGESTPAERQEISRLLREQKRQEVRERKWLMRKRKRESRARTLNAKVERVRREAADPQVSIGEITADEHYLRRYGMGRAERLATGGEGYPSTTQGPSIQEVARALRASKQAEFQARQAQVATPAPPPTQATGGMGFDDIPMEAMPPPSAIGSVGPEEAAPTAPLQPYDQTQHLAMGDIPGTEQPLTPPPSQEMGADEVISPVVTPEEEEGKVPVTDLSSFEDAVGEYELAASDYAAAVDVQEQAQLEIRQKQFDRRLEAEEIRRQSLSEADHELKDLISEVRNFRVNPNRLFPNTMSRLGAAISVALGGFAEAYSGGRVRNTALDIINNAVQQDIEAQKSALQASTQAMRGAENAYSKLLQKFEREDLATKALEIQELQLVSGKVQDMLVKAGITDKENPLSVFALKIDMQMKEKRIGFVRDRAAMKAQQAQSALGFAGLMQTRQANAAKEADDARREIEEKLNIEIPKHVQDGITGYLEGADMWQAYLELASGIEKNANAPSGFSLAKLLDKGAQFVMPNWLNAGERAQVNYLREHLSVDFMKAKEGSRMTDKDREFYRRLFPSYKSTIFGPEAAHHMITTMMAIKHRGVVAMLDNQSPNVRAAIFHRQPALKEFYIKQKHPAVKMAMNYWDQVQDANRLDDERAWYESDTEMPPPPSDIQAMSREDLHYDEKRELWVKKKP